MLADGSSLVSARKEREKERKAAEILDVAEQLFRKKGYHLTTTEEIARESGFSVGTLYNIFTDKEGLYAAILERMGREILARLENTVLRRRDPQAAVEELIKIRLFNHVRDRLFFQAFSSEGELGIQPEPSRLPRHVVALYSKYTHYVENLFKQAIRDQGLAAPNTFHMVLGLEGMINAFMGYWTRLGQSDSLDSTARHIKGILLSPVTLERIGALQKPEEPPSAEYRQVNISRFDLDRLKELITVARCFGKISAAPYLAELEARLSGARVVNPRDVPAELVTMNSVVELHDIEHGCMLVCALVFPIDAESKEENTSILSPLGTALLGSQVGDVIEVRDTKGVARYRIERILYQPEAAGDYHR